MFIQIFLGSETNLLLVSDLMSYFVHPTQRETSRTIATVPVSIPTSDWSVSPPACEQLAPHFTGVGFTGHKEPSGSTDYFAAFEKGAKCRPRPIVLEQAVFHEQRNLLFIPPPWCHPHLYQPIRDQSQTPRPQ